MEQEKNEQMGWDFDALEDIQNQLKEEIEKRKALEKQNEDLTEQLNERDNQLQTEAELRNSAVESAKEFETRMKNLESFENVKIEEVYLRATAAESRLEDKKMKYADVRGELYKLKEFIGEKKPSLLEKFEEMNVPEQDQKLNRFQKMIKSFDTSLRKEESKLSRDNVKYIDKENKTKNHDFMMRGDYNRENKNLLGRAFSIASLKTRRVMFEFAKDMDKSLDEIKHNLSEAKTETFESVATGSAYVGNITNRAWEKTGGRVVDATVGFGKEFSAKTKIMSEYMNTQMLRMEMKAMQNDDFIPSNSNSVIARAAVLGSHKVKKNLESKLSVIAEGTKEGFKSLVMGGKMLLGKLTNAVKAVHNIGMEGVNERESKKAKDGLDL